VRAVQVRLVRQRLLPQPGRPEKGLRCLTNAPA
jgi:hypothetical protein